MVKAQDAVYGYDVCLGLVDEGWDVKPDTVNEGLEPAALEKLWYATISRLFPSKSNTELRAHEWGQLKAEFSRDEIPFL